MRILLKKVINNNAALTSAIKNSKYTGTIVQYFWSTCPISQSYKVCIEFIEIKIKCFSQIV